MHGIIDDHSRPLVDHQCVYHDDAARFLTLFRHAIAHRGIPSMYVLAQRFCRLLTSSMSGRSGGCRRSGNAATELVEHVLGGA
jgi:hypothetical protein